MQSTKYAQAILLSTAVSGAVVEVIELAHNEQPRCVDIAMLAQPAPRWLQPHTHRDGEVPDASQQQHSAWVATGPSGPVRFVPAFTPL
jgi:hypothetical protein